MLHISYILQEASVEVVFDAWHIQDTFCLNVAWRWTCMIWVIGNYAALLTEQGVIWVQCGLHKAAQKEMTWINACVVGLPGLFTVMLPWIIVRHCWGTWAVCGVAPIMHKALGIDWRCNWICSMKLLHKIARLTLSSKMSDLILWLDNGNPYSSNFFHNCLLHEMCGYSIALFLCWLVSPDGDEPYQPYIVL
jgi:hypothetical protein